MIPRFVSVGIWTLILSALNLFLVFPLAAQTGQKIAVYVRPISGEDGGYFTAMIESEVKTRGFVLADDENRADYSLEGELVPYAMEYDDGFWSEPEAEWQALYLTLLNNETREAVVEQEMLYRNLSEVYEHFPRLVINMLGSFPLTKTAVVEKPLPLPLPDDHWRNKQLYAGFMFGWAPRLYRNLTDKDQVGSYWGSFNFGALLEWHFWSHLSLEAGIEYAGDRVIVPDTTVSMASLEIPLLLKGVFKPGSRFMLEPYGGLQFHVPLGEQTINIPSVSWALGFQPAFNVGPGAIFADLRFASDFSKSSVTYENGVVDFQRFMVKLSAGYKYGFFDRK